MKDAPVTTSLENYSGLLEDRFFLDRLGIACMASGLILLGISLVIGVVAFAT